MVPRTHPSTAVTLHPPTLTACVSPVPDCFKFCSNYSKRTNKGADYRVDHLTALVARLCDDDDDTSEVKQKKEARLQQAMTSIAKRRAAEPADSRCDMLCVRMCKSTHTISMPTFHTHSEEPSEAVCCLCRRLPAHHDKVVPHQLFTALGITPVLYDARCCLCTCSQLILIDTHECG